jgi:hypothetical protein
VQSLTHSGGTVIGAAPSVTPVVASLTTNPVTGSLAANLNSTVNPNGLFTTVFFQAVLSTAVAVSRPGSGRRAADLRAPTEFQTLKANS